MHIALLGGTFNPIHTGHLIMADVVFQTGRFDQVVLMPSGDPPHKPSVTIDKAHRLNMCQIVAEHKPYFKVSTYELEREGLTYTYDTMIALMSDTEDDYSLIIGADSLMQLEQWYRYEDLIPLCRFVVLDRMTVEESDLVEQIAYLEERYQARMSRVSMPYIGISSSMIKDRVKKHQSITYLVDKGVETYIQIQALYLSEDTLEVGYKDQVHARLTSALSKKRLAHTMGVKRLAVSLADHYGVDLNHAAVAAMLHDCAKSHSKEALIAIAKANHIKLTKDEMKYPKILHATIGAFIANMDYEVHDQSVLNAIRYHTTGRPEMSKLEKIIFIADYLEAGRKSFFGIEKLRALAFQDLDATMYHLLHDTVRYLQQEGAGMAQLTMDAYQYYEVRYNQFI